MNPVKLACLINDTVDAIERSKIGSIYLRDKYGNLITTPEGCPYANQAATQLLTSCISAQIIKDDYEN